MHALIYAYGSRGDVQPYLALAHAVDQAGHRATLVGPRRFGAQAAGYGIDFRPWNDESLDLLADPRFQDLVAADRGSRAEARAAGRALLEECFRLYPIMLREAAEAARDGADVVVHSQASAEAIHQIGERLAVPTVLASLYPNYVPSSHYPSSMFASTIGLPRPVNRLSHHVAARIPLPRRIRHAAATWRRDVLGLPPRRGFLDFRRRADGSPTPVLHGFSRHVLAPAPDWPRWVHQTGFWHLPADPAWRPGAELVDFLAAGPAIAVGFGSLAGTDPRRTGREVAAALRETGTRAVAITGWGGIDLPRHPDILVLEQAPYDWLFPRVTAVVHAGGAGTCDSALRAAVPQIPVPFHREQLMWSRHMHRLGVATTPLPHRELTADDLAARLRQVRTREPMRAAATRLAASIKAEHGTAEAVAHLERITALAGAR